jgi:hypothetical protein
MVTFWNSPGNGQTELRKQCDPAVQVSVSGAKPLSVFFHHAARQDHFDGIFHRNIEVADLFFGDNRQKSASCIFNIMAPILSVG